MTIEQIIIILILLAVVIYFFTVNKSPFELLESNLLSVVSAETELTEKFENDENNNMENLDNVDDENNNVENLDNVDDENNNMENLDNVDDENNNVEAFNNIVNNSVGANNLQYATTPQPNISSSKAPPVYGASSQDGVMPDNLAAFTPLQTNANVDVFTKIVDNQQLQQNFERSFLLDPTGNIAQNDITQGKFSPDCCPAQWSPSFMETNKPLSPDIVPNNYSGDSVNGSGCACITMNQANYIRTRGGNSAN